MGVVVASVEIKTYRIVHLLSASIAFLHNLSHHVTIASDVCCILSQV